MAQWKLDDIPWERFDPSKVTPDTVAVVKAACMVEHNGHDYARYLCEVFKDDPEFQAEARRWAGEEVQHGQALRRWAELADPDFDFDISFKRFTEGYRLPEGVEQSVRGSRSGELIARCVVETGTSSYYTALKDATEEPVLQAVCAKIAADEFRHYLLFYNYLRRYLEREKIGSWKRLRIALSRIAESEDDELAYAYFAANTAREAAYNHQQYKKMYLSRAYRLYQRRHVERMVPMLLKAVGLTPNGRLSRFAGAFTWRVMRWRVARSPITA